MQQIQEEPEKNADHACMESSPARLRLPRCRVSFVGIDEEPSIIKGLRPCLDAEIDWEIEWIEDGREFLDNLEGTIPHIAVVKSKARGLSGHEVLLELGLRDTPPPCIFIADQPSLPLVLAARKLGAVDIVLEPVDTQRLLNAIELAVEFSLARPLVDITALSPIERRILCYVLLGYSSKEIAHRRHRSARTIERHRGVIMKKLGVDGLPGLLTRFFLTRCADCPYKKGIW